MKKSLKSILCFTIAGTMVLSGIANVFAAGPYTDSADSIYFFEDFNDAAPNGTNIWDAKSGIGTNLPANLPFGSYLMNDNRNQSGSAALEGDVDFEEDGATFKSVVDTYASFAFDRAYNNTFFVSGRKAPVGYTYNKVENGGAELKGFLPGWNDYKGWILVTTDIKVPQSGGSDYTLKGYISHICDENVYVETATKRTPARSPKYVAATFPDIRVSADGSTVTAIGEGTTNDGEDMNESMHAVDRAGFVETELTDVKPGDWIQLQVVIQKYIWNETRKYQVWQFVNGELVSASTPGYDGVFVNANSAQGDFIEYTNNGTSYSGTNYKGLTVEFISETQTTADTERYLGIDNIKFTALGLSDTFGLDKDKASYNITTDTATGKGNNAVIKFKQTNTAFANADKSAVTTASGLEALESLPLKKGAEITVTKYDKENNSSVLSDVIDTNWGTRTKERTTLYGSDTGNENIDLSFYGDESRIIPNGTELHLKNLDLAPGERAVVEVEGYDLMGTEVNLEAEISCEQTVTLVDLKKNEKPYKLSEADGEIELDMVPEKLVIQTSDTTDNSTSYSLIKKSESGDSEVNVVKSFDADTGTYTLEKILEPECSYVLKRGAAEIFAFKSGPSEITVLNAAASGGTVTFDYVNTFSSAKNIYLFALKNVSNVPTVTDVKKVELVPGTQTGKTVAGFDTSADSAAVVIEMQSNKYTKDEEFIKVNPMNYAGEFTVDGKLSAKGGTLVWFKDNAHMTAEPNVLYAAKFASESNIGEYTQSFAMGGKNSKSGEHYVVMFGDDGTMYYDTFNYSDPTESKAALQALNDAADVSAEAVLAVMNDTDPLTNYKAALMFSNDAYDAMPTYQLTVAKYIKNYINKNGDFNKDTDKFKALSVFEESIVAAQFEHGLAASIKDYEDKVEWKNKALVKEWLNKDSATPAEKAVTADTMNAWLTNIKGRLKADHGTADAFKEHVEAAIVFSVIDTPEKYDIIEEMFTDFKTVIGLDDTLVEYKAINGVFGAEDTTYTGFAYTDLIEDMEGYRDAHTSGNKNPPAGGGGGGGGGRLNVPVTGETPVEPSKPVEPQNPTDTDKVFNDLSGVEWAEEAIETLYDLGIISGHGNGGFAPNDNITREQIVKMIVNLVGLEDTDIELEFNDLENDAWYIDSISAAFKAGIISGYDNGEFGVGDFVSRQDICKMVCAALVLKGVEIDTTAPENITDMESVSDYAKDAVSALVNLMVINGYEDGTFRPTGLATRAEAAKIIFGLLEYID